MTALRISSDSRPLNDTKSSAKKTHCLTLENSLQDNGHRNLDEDDEADFDESMPEDCNLEKDCKYLKTNHFGSNYIFSAPRLLSKRQYWKIVEIR